MKKKVLDTTYYSTVFLKILEYFPQFLIGHHKEVVMREKSFCKT